jgi:hypothetical protein
LLDSQSAFAVHVAPTAARLTQRSVVESHLCEVEQTFGHSLQCDPSLTELHGVGTPFWQTAFAATKPVSVHGAPQKEVTALQTSPDAQSFAEWHVDWQLPNVVLHARAAAQSVSEEHTVPGPPGPDCVAPFEPHPSKHASPTTEMPPHHGIMRVECTRICARARKRPSFSSPNPGNNRRAGQQ